MYQPNIFGMNISVSQYIEPRPKIQLSPDFNACSDSVKHEMNKWLLEMFGTEDVVYVMGGNIVMSPKTFAKLMRR